ncbi:hypothetical protein D3C86_1262810 [compost metagenome]
MEHAVLRAVNLIDDEGDALREHELGELRVLGRDPFHRRKFLNVHHDDPRTALQRSPKLRESLRLGGEAARGFESPGFVCHIFSQLSAVREQDACIEQRGSRLAAWSHTIRKGLRQPNHHVGFSKTSGALQQDGVRVCAVSVQQRVVDDLLDFRRIELGEVKRQPRPDRRLTEFRLLLVCVELTHAAHGLEEHRPLGRPRPKDLGARRRAAGSDLVEKEDLAINPVGWMEKGGQVVGQSCARRLVADVRGRSKCLHQARGNT